MQTLSNGEETYGHGTLLPCLAFTSAEAEISPSSLRLRESEDEKRREVTPNGWGDFQAEVTALLAPGRADPSFKGQSDGSQGFCSSGMGRELEEIWGVWEVMFGV